MKLRKDVRRILELAQARLPDRDRWGGTASYKDLWNERSVQAARMVPDGIRLLEIGVGKGGFRNIVQQRCHYVGADLNPLDAVTLPLDLDSQPLPPGPFDMIVLLGVIEYLHDLPGVIAKLRAAAPALLLSYCCIPEGPLTDDIVQARREIGWVNDLSPQEFRAAFVAPPFRLAREEPYKRPGAFHDQRIFLFTSDASTGESGAAQA